MKLLALILCLIASTAHAQSDADLLLLMQLKAGVTPTALPPCGGGSGEGWTADSLPITANSLPITPSQKPASKPQVAANSLPLVKPEPPKPAVLKAPTSKPVVKQSLTTGHWETRTRKVCKGGYCTTERYRVWVADKPAKQSSYPIRGSWWSHPPDLKAHLIKTHGYSASYVNSLSKAELESLHSDTHEGKVRR